MIHTTIKGIEITLVTSPVLFSPNSIDRGTLALLSQTEFAPGDKVLDLGCGSGVVGILAAKILGDDRVFCSDVDPEAVRAARDNAKANAVPGIKVILSDGLAQIEDRDFTLILSNPPYHTDFSVAKGFIENGFRHLAIGGRMLLVTKRLDWYRNKLKAVFGNVSVRPSDGYYVFEAVKKTDAPPRKTKPEPHLSKKLQRKEALKKRPHQPKSGSGD